MLTPIIYAESARLIDRHKRAGAQDRDHLVVADRDRRPARRASRCRRSDRHARGSTPTGGTRASSSSRVRPAQGRRDPRDGGAKASTSRIHARTPTRSPTCRCSRLVGNPMPSTPTARLRGRREAEWGARWFQHPVRLRDRVPVPRRADVGGGHRRRRGRHRGRPLRLAPPDARRARARCAPRAERTFAAMTAPTAMTTKSRRIFFTGLVLLETLLAGRSVAPARGVRGRANPRNYHASLRL